MQIILQEDEDVRLAIDAVKALALADTGDVISDEEAVRRSLITAYGIYMVLQALDSKGE
jgi:hypothetical protein